MVAQSEGVPTALGWTVLAFVFVAIVFERLFANGASFLHLLLLARQASFDLHDGALPVDLPALFQRQ